MSGRVPRKRKWVLPVIALAAPLWLAGACNGEQPAPQSVEPTYDELLSEGTSMAEVLCAGCHAIGARDESIHPSAPAFRDLSDRVELDALREPFKEGILTSHPDMPEWQFEPRHVDALLTYLESVQTRD